MREPIETVNKYGLVGHLYHDEYADSPESWEDPNAGIVTTKNRHFSVQQGRFDVEDCRAKIVQRKNWIFPLRAHVHSGVALSLSDAGYPFNDAWDSGWIGWVYVAKSQARLRKSALKIAEGIVGAWNQYLSGDVYGFVVEDWQGNQLDSCWGFYGIEYVRQELESSMKANMADKGMVSA